MKVVHVGCGNTILPNAVNIDYIRPFKYIRYPKIANIMCHMGLLSRTGYQLIQDLYPVREFIKWGRATNLPVKDEDADIVYSSHMMEHLTHEEAEQFLKEVLRILKSGGGFRLVLPDLQYYINRYCKNHDADEFLRKTYLTSSDSWGGGKKKYSEQNKISGIWQWSR